MIRCVRLYCGLDGDSKIEEGFIDLPFKARGDQLSALTEVASIHFRQTEAGGEFEWHNAPVRQFVITLSGILEFEVRDGSKVTIAPGDLLLAEDTTGTGHRWRLLDQNPWHRAYVILKDEVQIPFVARANGGSPS